MRAGVAATLTVAARGWDPARLVSLSVRVGVLPLSVAAAALMACGPPAPTEAENAITVTVSADLADPGNPGCSGVPAWVKARLKVMAVGDSITAGSPDGTSYRSFLHQILNEFPSRQEVAFVGHLGAPAPCCHEGYSGKRTRFIADAIGGWTVVWQPDVILLMVGTNDLDPAAVPDYLRALDQALSIDPRVTILAAPVIYWEPDDGRRRAFDVALATAVRAHPAFGTNVRWVEAMGDAVAPGEDFLQSDGTSDGLHPGASGARKMADVWYAAGKGFLWP